MNPRLLFLLAPLLLCGCGPGESGGGALEIAVIPKGTTHEFWKSIHAGANKAASELGVRVVWKGPAKEDARADQIEVVEDMIARGVDGIVLAPLDDKALVRPCEDAVREGVPVVIIDSGLDWDGYVSFVATDNYRGGVLGALRLGEVMGGKGRALMMRYQEGSASTMKREAGFLDTMRARFPDVEIVSDNQYGGATTESAYRTAENLLSSFPDIEGIFCPNESTTFGMLRALQDAGRAEDVAFVGFDASEKLVEALEAGELDGLVVQNPFRMGEDGVRILVSHLRGEAVDERVDTGVIVATRENMDREDVRALLFPDLERWL